MWYGDAEEPVGGRDHQAVEGATHARDLEDPFGQMNLF
jgi:hypothetical protein